MSQARSAVWQVLAESATSTHIPGWNGPANISDLKKMLDKNVDTSCRGSSKSKTHPISGGHQKEFAVTTARAIFGYSSDIWSEIDLYCT